MNKQIKKRAIGASIFFIIGLLLTVSCGPKEYKKISLESLDPKLKKTGSLIVKDILTSITHNNGLDTF